MSAEATSPSGYPGCLNEDFVEQVLAQAETPVQATLGWRGRAPSLLGPLDTIAQREGGASEDLRRGP